MAEMIMRILSFFVFLQLVHHTDSSVTLVNAFISHTDVTATATAVIAVMNATVVSFLK